ncbi:MAG: hypothetical protein NTW21_43050 [Verrucomicrobia bacterium]|nr:hypothetical protein [Verrucomicrobiota bacterium]
MKPWLLLSVFLAVTNGMGETLATESAAVLKRNLLAAHRDELRRIAFTKHFDMGGSHYAYTDAVSDEDTLNPSGTVKEFNLTGGSSLCLLETGDDYEFKENTLIQDDDGVFRDPDVSYDGKRILFAWKKSARAMTIIC